MSSTQLENQPEQIETDLRNLAQEMVSRAMSGGASAAECVIAEGDEFSTLVRLGQVETLRVRLEVDRRSGVQWQTYGQHILE